MSTEVERKIVKARVQLLLHKPFFGFLSTYLDPVEVSNMIMPTMGVDGKHLFYDKNFVEKATNTEIQTIIAHEILHLALGHIWRKGSRNEMVLLPNGTPILKWNIATDAIVNYHLTQQGFNLPENTVQMREAENLSAEELYSKIKPEQMSVSMSIMDDHDSWNKAGEKGKGKGKGEGEGKEGIGDDAGEAFKELEKKAKELESKWKQLTAQARQIQKTQGKGMGSLEELIDDLIEPSVSWREVLRNAVISVVKNDYRIIPPNKKHLWRGMYLPSTFGEEIEIAYFIDTSGSMSTEEVKEGLSELKGVCDSFPSYKIHFYQGDYSIQEYKEITSYNFDFPKKIRGRGGTSFIPVFKDIDERGIRPSILILFTDGWGDIPKSRPPYVVMWLITEEGAKEDSGYWQQMSNIGIVVRYRRNR